MTDPVESMAQSMILHASCIAIAGKALLILGPSGSGKSALALKLMAYGAGLISDDQTGLRREGGRLIAFCPSAAIRGLIEARGIGLLRSPAAIPSEVVLVVDLAQPEQDRLPPRRTISLAGCLLPLVLGAQNDHLAEGLLAWMKGGRQE